MGKVEVPKCQCRASWIAWFFIVAGQPQRLSQGLGEISEACEGSLQGTLRQLIAYELLRLVVHDFDMICRCSLRDSCPMSL